VCARVDVAAVAGMLGNPGLRGVRQSKGGITTGLGHGGSVCFFQLPENGSFEIGINPIPMTPAIPGAEVAMRTLVDLSSLDRLQPVPGVGDLALYEPMQPPGEAGITHFWVVKGEGVRWYGVTIWGYDPTPEHSMLGKVTREQLAGLATRCLTGL
jgi:hypothetical protein